MSALEFMSSLDIPAYAENAPVYATLHLGQEDKVLRTRHKHW